MAIIKQLYRTISWHLIDDDAVVKTGQVVKAGDLLGYGDNTGQSTGDHLHFGLHIIGTDLNNGYKGFSDPQLYFNGKYAEEINNPVIIPKFQFTKTLKLNSWNNDVKQLQIVLNKQDNNLVVDGIFGVKTLKAVKEFQLNNQLVPDGIVGILTIGKLNKWIL